MMMMFADDSSVSKQVARKSWARLWRLRRQEKGASYTIFRELSVEDSDGFCEYMSCLLYTSPSPRDGLLSRMPSSA